MIVSICNDPLEVQQAKEALDTSCWGVIIMQDSEDWHVLREAIDLAYCSYSEAEDNMQDKFREILYALL